MSDENSRPEHNVRHFRQILLWPLQLMPIRKGAQIQRHWELLERDAAGNPWRCVEDEFTGDPGQFQERHYSEFVAFLPYVQRFLYGEGGIRGGAAGESPIRVFRRGDVTQVRLVYPRHGGSSWQSVARGTGDIEADYLNGEIVLIGRRCGIATPANAVVQRLGNTMAVQRLSPGHFKLAEVRALIDAEAALVST